MAKYVLTYKGGSGAPADEAEQQKVMAAWGAWLGGLGDSLVDAGNPFGPSAAVSADGSTNGSAPSGLTGYSIITADSLAAAGERTKGCPIFAAGGSVEVYETFEVM